MSDPNQPTTPAGWYPDGQGAERWWDGTRWTEHTRNPAAPEPQQPQQSFPPTPSSGQETMVAPQQPGGYGQQPGAGAPYGAPPAGAPNYGGPGYGAPNYGGPGYGAPNYGGPNYGPGPSGSRSGNGKLFALIGAGIAALVVVILLVVVLVKVVGGDSPASVAEAYLKANAESDVETICELSTADEQDDEFEEYDVDSCGEYIDEAQDDIDELFEDFEKEYDESLDDISDDTSREVEIGDVDEDGDEATVEWEETRTYDGDNDAYLDGLLGGERTSTEDGTMLLCQEDGAWKVKAQYFDEDSDDGC